MDFSGGREDDEEKCGGPVLTPRAHKLSPAKKKIDAQIPRNKDDSAHADKKRHDTKKVTIESIVFFSWSGHKLPGGN